MSRCAFHDNFSEHRQTLEIRAPLLIYYRYLHFEMFFLQLYLRSRAAICFNEIKPLPEQRRFLLMIKITIK